MAPQSPPHEYRNSLIARLQTVQTTGREFESARAHHFYFEFRQDYDRGLSGIESASQKILEVSSYRQPRTAEVGVSSIVDLRDDRPYAGLAHEREEALPRAQ